MHCKRPNRLASILIAVMALAAASASAETLYKLIDKNGKVTYSEAAPKNFDGQVIRIDVDPNANTMVAPKAPAPPAVQPEGKGATENEKIIRRRVVTNADRLQAARDKVDAARKAYEDARDNPGEDDQTWIARGANPLGIRAGDPQKPPPVVPPKTDFKPAPPGQPSPLGVPTAPALPQVGQKISGARPVPTEEYAARLAALEKAWHDAEEELRVLERELK